MDALKVFLQYSLFLLTIKTSASCSPTCNYVSSAMEYLRQFHYMSPRRYGNHDFRTAVELFQIFMHLPVTGNLDYTTITEMRKPRCGVPDLDGPLKSQRFAVGRSKWNTTDLTYGVFNTGNDMSAAKVKSILKKAFNIWSQSTALNFTYVTDVNTADIKISFGAKTHGSCGYPFDGPGNVLGHAFYPPDGDMHIDDDEHFTDGTYSGTNLLYVAVHEIGHVIGIGHSSEKDAIMYPQYPGYEPNLRLHADDINAAAKLYGGPTAKPPPPLEY